MTGIGRALVAAALGLGLLLVPSALVHAADDDGNDSANLTVTVTDGSTPSPTPRPTSSSAAPVPSPSSGRSGPGTGATGGSGGAAGGGGVGAGSGTGTGTGTGGTVSIAGMVYVSGVNSSVALSPDPAEADVTLWLSVRNASSSVIDLTADFWMESVLFGTALDSASAVPVTGLQPGETRLISTRLHGAGQWGLVNTHVKITPPATVDGTALTPLTRDALVVVFPWLSILLAATLVIALLAWRAVALALAAKTSEATA
ncbi:hypothetical protein E5344_09145 [Microbacterium laevaniformans]|uniref:DUF916 domain-containing protein n=1 Tax=Microbacterium laevaniformans TaxID=36807 RepID=A0A4V3RJP6_9MICO|nr:hypothetical protein [Microbacterium laevaniformans]TGY36770.1 hypothetical protein E5344_09145 [Microbacterium laevaniformans]